MNERRRKTRRRTPCQTAVFDSSTGEHLGWVVNITCEGIMLRGEEAMNTDQIYDLRIELPDPIKGHSRLDVRAHTLWSQRSVDPAYYNTGLQLVEVPAHVNAVIELLVRDAVFQRWVS